MPRETIRREKASSPVPAQGQRPAKKPGRVTIEDVEAIVRWYLDTHCYTPWFDTKAAAAYLRREPGTLRGWRSKGEGPPFYHVNHQFIRDHLDDLDAFIRGGKRRKRISKRLKARIIAQVARQAASGD